MERVGDNMHDSGERQGFDSGAVRDTAEGKARPDLISAFAEERLGAWLALGAAKYSDRNWEKGIPVSRSYASLRRHILQFVQGDTQEDHLAAIMCNAMFMLDHDERVKRGLLGPEFSDMPKYAADGRKVLKPLPGQMELFSSNISPELSDHCFASVR